MKIFHKNLILLILLILILSTQPAFQQNGLVIKKNQLVLNFPENLTFELILEADTVIEKVTLVYSCDMRTCQSKSARKDLEFDADEQLSLTWEWDFSRNSTIPPGAVVEWQWEITDNRGDIQVTEEKSLILHDQRYDWQEISGGGISVQWFLGDDSFGSEVHRIALDSLGHVSTLMDIEATQEIWITVYPSPDDVKDAVKFTTEWVGGIAFPNHYAMIIAGLPGDDHWLRTVIPHELTHLLIESRTFNCQGSWLPRWFEEGMADYAEDVLENYERDQIWEAFQGNGIPRLRSLVTTFSQDSDQAHLAYMVSNAAVEYMIQEFGSEKMGELLDQLGSGMMIDPALEAVYGLDTDSLDIAWRKSFGLDVDDFITSMEDIPATDTPHQTLAPYTSAVQLTSTSTSTPQPKIKRTSTSVPDIGLARSPTELPAITPSPRLESTNPKPKLFEIGFVLFVILLIGSIVLFRRRI